MSPTPNTSIRPTINDVAKYAGVSTATVSRVINRTAPVSKDTTERVWAAVEALNYRPSSPARMLASQKTGTIGLVIPEIGGEFFAPMLRGVESGARHLGYDLLIFANLEANAEHVHFPYPLGEHNTDGLLIFTDSLNETEIKRLHQINFPLVLLHRSPPDDLHIPCVDFNNKAGARMLVDHLIEVHGYRRIGFLSGPPKNEDSYWREAGYRQSMQDHNMHIKTKWLRHGGFDNDEAYAEMQDWLVEGLDVEAIFTGDDEAALGVILALREKGISIPEQVAVVGFDDIPLSRHLSPPLTTIRAPIEQIGRISVQNLVRLINAEPVEPLVLLPVELVVRHSCGCQPKNEPTFPKEVKSRKVI
jgi:DNA-binding LacI/PurR family transcriptional regulator